MDAVLRVIVWAALILAGITVIAMIASVFVVTGSGASAAHQAIASGGVDANHGVWYWLYALDYSGTEHPRGDMKPEWAASPRAIIGAAVTAFLGLWMGLLAFRIFNYFTAR